MGKSEVEIELPYLQDFQSKMRQQSVAVNTKFSVLTDRLISVNPSSVTREAL